MQGMFLVFMELHACVRCFFDKKMEC